MQQSWLVSEPTGIVASRTAGSSGSRVRRLTGPEAYRSPPTDLPSPPQEAMFKKNVVYRISALAMFGH